MSSYESNKSSQRWHSSSGSFTDSMQSSSSRDYSTGTSSNSSSNFIPPLYESSDEVCSTLPELTQVPWTEGDVLAVLQRGELKELCGNISIECLQRLAYLLQRPLTRIAREAERLCCAVNKCCKEDIVTASKLVLSPGIFEETNKIAAQSTILHALSSGDNNNSKSSLSSLTLSVGKHQRWLLEALPAAYIHELSAVYLAATMESIIEQTACLALQQHSERILRDEVIVTTDMLEAGIRSYPELHSLYNPCSQLLPTADWRSASTPTSAVERNLKSRCVSSVQELTDTVEQAMHFWCSKSTRNSALQWSSSAISTLFYFTKCSKQENSTSHLSVSLRCPRRNSTTSPPIVEWVRLATIFTEHRRGHVIDNDDVMQVARLVLPAVDCPPRSSRTSDTISLAELSDNSSAEVQRKFGLFLLSSRITELKKLASTFINKSDINSFNKQGVTPLMVACTNGDVSTTLTLLKSGASVDMAVSSHHASFPGWTALCFAVSNGHLDIAKLLLDYGSSVDAAADSDSVETPLQLASAAGHLELVGLLLKHHANPHRQTCVQKGVEVKGSLSAYTLATSHGRRDVVRCLFSDSLQLYNKKLLTLSEMLAECNDQSHNMPSLQQKQDEQENEYMVIENDYVTIEEVQQHDVKYEKLRKKLSPYQVHTLQAAMYHAAENGFLDLTLEIHSAGVPWTMYVWYMSLNTAHVMQRKAVVQSLLRDFNSIDYANNTVELCEACLSLMFDIFRESKNEMVSQQLAVIFSRLYGSQPVPLLKAARNQSSLLIQSSYVNSKEMADVSFVVEGKLFYAHQVILASASMRFKNMLSAFTEVAMPEIEIRDIAYDTFERVMRYVYEGSCIGKISNSADFKSVKRLLGAAHYFQLDALKRKSEILLSKNLSVDNCLSVYKAAKMYSCMELMEICEAYFLQHLDRLLAKCEEFKRILYSSKVHNRELMSRLSNALAARLHSNLLAKRNKNTAL